MHTTSASIAAVSAVCTSVIFALFVDSQTMVFLLIFLGGSGAAFYFFAAPRVSLRVRHTFSLAILMWIVWTASGAVYGIRSLQVVSLLVSVGAAIVVMFGAVWLWEQLLHTPRTLTRLHFLLAVEGALVLFFATTSFFILGAINAVWFVGVGMLLRDAQVGAEPKRLWRVAVWCGACLVLLVLSGRWYL